MRRSPTSSCSSSSSCVGSDDNLVPDDQSERPKSKRSRKNHNQRKCGQVNTSHIQGAARRSSIYRGVTRHRWTGRFEAHLWDKSSWNNIQNKKGRQVYLGAYDNEEAAARTYDLAAIKYWGPTTTLNFPIEKYEKEAEEMQNFSKEEYLASLRRRSSGFSRGVSKYRGVARHHHNGRWEARIGRVVGNKYLYLGTYNTQEEAAAAYDMAAIEYRGANAVTNFDISHYIDRLKNTTILYPERQPRETLLAANCSDNSSEQEVEQQQQQDQQQQHINVLAQLQYQNIIPTVENDLMEMEPTDTCELSSWSFLDSGLITPLPVAEFPLERPGDVFPDLFDDMRFEDNIDLIFESECSHSELVGVVDADVSSCSRGVEKCERGAGRLSCSNSTCSSNSLVTTTEVSCNFCV